MSASNISDLRRVLESKGFQHDVPYKQCELHVLSFRSSVDSDVMRYCCEANFLFEENMIS